MYSLHPTMMEMLANQRADELSRQAAPPRRRQSRLETRTQWETVADGANASSRGYPSNLGRLTSVRKAAGWALVEIGLRLAVPRRRLVPGGSAVRGRGATRRKAGVTVAG